MPPIETPSSLTLAQARDLDAADALGAFRDRFQLEPGVTYLDGNSLGPPPRATAARMAEVVSSEWGEGLIRSWNNAGWMQAPTRAGAKIARLIGARPNEVLVADSTSVNLFKLLAAGMARQADRTVILTESGSFPTDLYIAQGVASFLPYVEVRAVAREAILDALGADVGVLLLTHVQYKTAEAFDIASMTRAAQAHGALTLWDLSHSTGAVAVDLDASGADLAVGCGYKYLNGGPGAPAFLYVAERHQQSLHSPLSGWMGHVAPFDFGDDYRPADGLARFLCGTPPILGLAALEVGVDLMLKADLAQVFAKSQRLCSLFISQVEARCAGHGLTLATPRAPALRGAHVSFRHPEGYAVMQALIAREVIGDFRAPDILRFGFPALYVRYEDVWTAAEVLHDVLASGAWRDAAFGVRAAVT